jgi:hypothetical protein
MPKSNDGDQRSAEAQIPDAAAGTHDPPAHAGAETPADRKTTTGRPTPTARATASHEPDPPPQTGAEATGAPHAGEQTAGHGPDGNATKPPPGLPATAAANTNRDRAANAARPADRGTQTTDAPSAAAAAAHDDAGTGETAKTLSRSPSPQPQTVAATAASTPRAQPTATSRPEARTDTTAGDTKPGTTEREPANATPPDTATPPGEQRPHHRNRETAPRPSSSPRGGARKARSEAAKRATEGSALAAAGGDPARVK